MPTDGAEARPVGDDWQAWFRLACTPGVGRGAVRRWLAAFGSANAVLRAPDAALSASASPRAVEALRRAVVDGESACARASEWLSGSARPAVSAVSAM